MPVKKGYKQTEEHKKKRGIYTIPTKYSLDPRFRNYRKNHPGVEKYNGMRARAKERRIPFSISLAGFREWYYLTPKICSYCNLDIQVKTASRMRNLSIDRKYNELGYIKDNICFSCNLCNTIKGNVFTYDEMLEIGHKYIRPKWEAVTSA